MPKSLKKRSKPISRRRLAIGAAALGAALPASVLTAALYHQRLRHKRIVNNQQKRRNTLQKNMEQRQHKELQNRQNVTRTERKQLQNYLTQALASRKQAEMNLASHKKLYDNLFAKALMLSSQVEIYEKQHLKALHDIYLQNAAAKERNAPGNDAQQVEAFDTYLRRLNSEQANSRVPYWQYEVGPLQSIPHANATYQLAEDLELIDLLHQPIDRTQALFFKSNANAAGKRVHGVLSYDDYVRLLAHSKNQSGTISSPFTRQPVPRGAVARLPVWKT